MNVRLAVHLLVSMALALAMVFGGAALGGPAAGFLGFLLWFVVEALVKALLPPSFLPGIEDAQPTSATYRGWAAKLVNGAGLAKSRTVQADAARLAAGVRLCVLTFGLRDGSQTLGYLLLQQSRESGTTVAWRGRGKGQQVQPLPATMTVPQGRSQQNATQARLGYTVSVQIGDGSYWLRSHDAELLKLLLEHETVPSRATA